MIERHPLDDKIVFRQHQTIADRRRWQVTGAKTLAGVELGGCRNALATEFLDCQSEVDGCRVQEISAEVTKPALGLTQESFGTDDC